MKVSSSVGVENADHSPLTPRQAAEFFGDLPDEALDGTLTWIVREVGSQRDPEHRTVGVRVTWEREAASARPTSPGSRTDYIDPSR